jgi:hypothetical protein
MTVVDPRSDVVLAKRERRPAQIYVDKLAYNVAEVCAAAGFHKSKCWTLLETGELPSRLVAGRRLVMRADLEAFLEGDEGVSPRGCKARAMASTGEAR